MKLQDFFETNSGRGVLSTADGAGNVDAAVYATPHFMEDQQIAFIMREKLSHSNLQENPKAAYLFMTEGKGVSGIRLYLEKTSEEQDSAKIEEIYRRKGKYEENKEAVRHLVYFKVNKILPLVGSGDPEVSL
ncbi:pyridoxamine 5'-phosphate oxidase family protein [Desulfopila inferna]|uniref:pyridoxamine 5'-phosphate oxidase family protein n=1 Tax=Desulfopila inferna TaxID=468528 RepID=UPI001964B679|nr:pyridoxamine 5'-phosphate oxidase family protein [Desulfopila inferna]MBM9604019.1 pyridoxamine 5'-phosphate oxidase family protein [Desulfopila inferna]